MYLYAYAIEYCPFSGQKSHLMVMFFRFSFECKVKNKVHGVSVFIYDIWFILNNVGAAPGEYAAHHDVIMPG